MASLLPDPTLRFDCQRCGDCCTSRDPVLLTSKEQQRIAEQLGARAGAVLVSRAGRWTLARAPATSRCALLTPDNLCELRQRFGEEAPPAACQRFPRLAVPAGGTLRISASFGCTAIQQHSGAPLMEQRAHLHRLFAQELSELGEPTPESLQLESAARALGGQLFPAMRRLAAWGEAASGSEIPPLPRKPHSIVRPAAPLDLSGPARYAFALTLLPDALDTSRLWDRLQSLLTLPRLMGFVHVYRSRALDAVLAMSQIWRHPGVLPPESEVLLLRFLSARLHDRSVLRRVSSLAAGLTRLLLQVDLTLYYARALAGEGPITHDQIRRGLTLAERLSHPRWGDPDLGRQDPRLPELWAQPGVLSAAAVLFEPPTP